MRPLRRRAAGRPDRRSDGPPREAERADALMAATAQGDESAFAELYDLIAPLVHGIVLKVLRNPAQAEEVSQEALVEIWRLAPRYDPSRGSVKGWSASIAHRRAVDRVRSEQAARDREDRVHVAHRSPGVQPDEVVEDRLDRQRVRAALATLTDVQRQAVELAYHGGHTYREVAALLGVPPGTASTRIRDGLIRLRDHMGVTA